MSSSRSASRARSSSEAPAVVDSTAAAPARVIRPKEWEVLLTPGLTHETLGATASSAAVLRWPRVFDGWRMGPREASASSGSPDGAPASEQAPPGPWTAVDVAQVWAWIHSDDPADEQAWLTWLTRIPAAGSPELRDGLLRGRERLVVDPHTGRLHLLPLLSQETTSQAGGGLRMPWTLITPKHDGERLWLAALMAAERRQEVWSPVLELLLALRPRPDGAHLDLLLSGAGTQIRVWEEAAKALGYGDAEMTVALQQAGLDRADALRWRPGTLRLPDGRARAAIGSDLVTRSHPPLDDRTALLLGWWMRQSGRRNAAVRQGPLPPPRLLAALVTGEAWGRPDRPGEPLRGDTTWHATLEHLLARPDLTASHLRAIARGIRPGAPDPLVLDPAADVPATVTQTDGTLSRPDPWGFSAGWSPHRIGRTDTIALLHQLIDRAEATEAGPVWPDLAELLLRRLEPLAELFAQWARDEHPTEADLQIRAAYCDHRQTRDAARSVLPGLVELRLLQVAVRQRGQAPLVSVIEQVLRDGAVLHRQLRMFSRGGTPSVPLMGLTAVLQALSTAWALQPDLTAASWTGGPQEAWIEVATVAPLLAKARPTLFLEVADAAWFSALLDRERGAVGHGQDAFLLMVLTHPTAGTQLWQSLFPVGGGAPTLRAGAGGEKLRELLLRRLLRHPETAEILRQPRYLGPWLKCTDRTMRELAVRVMGQRPDAGGTPSCSGPTHR